MIESQNLLNYFKENKKKFNQNLTIRLHRSLSWYKRSTEVTDDNDARFIFLWIGFNATYTGLGNFENQVYEKNLFNKYFKNLVDNDEKNFIYEYIWKKYTSTIRSVLTNEYLLPSYWKNYKENYNVWIDEYEKEKKLVNKALSENNSLTILNILFERLYILRNQIFHGNSTWNSKVNREQLDKCVKLLNEIIPVFLTIMMTNPNVDWGEIIVPVLSS